MSPGLSPTKQLLILHMYIMLEDSSLHSFRENCDTQIYLEKLEKWT